MLDLVQRAQGGSRSSALGWLAELNGVPLDEHPLTEAERCEFARQRAEASDLVAWKGRLVDTLRRERERWWAIYHGALRYLLDHGLDSPLGWIAADLHELAERRLELLNWRVDALVPATVSDLLTVSLAQKQRSVA